MSNNDIRYSADYHESTKHSELGIQLSRHRLDWNNKPRSFKFYTRLSPIPLPTDFPKPEINALTAISSIEPIKQSPDNIVIKTIAEILFFSAGITREMKYNSGTLYMRAASATGALYPIELYLVCEDMVGLQAGVYHFNPGDFTLTRLREGDYRSELAEYAGGNENIINSPVTIVFSSIAWRNAWKYNDRSYRHWFWDSGVIASNLLATTSSMGLCTNFSVGFVDDQVNKLLCLDDRREASIALAAIGAGLSKTSTFTNKKDIPVLNYETLPLSKKGEVEYPLIWKMHEASYLHSKEEVKNWVSVEMDFWQNPTTEVSILKRRPLISENYYGLPSLSEVILLRGSSRQFSRKPISLTHLTNILHSSTKGVPLDFVKGGKVSTIDIYFIANDVEELNPGCYYFNRTKDSLDQLKKDISRDTSGYLCLGQSLFSDASVVFFLMTSLEQVLGTFGNRGYRAAQFESGIIAGKIYLAAYGQGISASGSTFFDDLATEFFSPHAKDKSTMIVVGVGVPGYESKSGKILAGKLNREQLLTEGL